MQDIYTIEDLDTLKALSHPLRLTMVKRFKTPKTVKTVAAKMSMPPTKLYYHVNLLEQQGILTVTDTNVVSGIIEKTYQVAARHFRIDEKLLSDTTQHDEKLDAILDLVLDSTRTSLRRALAADSPENMYKDKLLVRAEYRLTPEQAETFRQELEALVTKYEALSKQQTDAENTAVYALSALHYPVVNEDDGSIEGDD